jgi:hypothetical protein
METAVYTLTLSNPGLAADNSAITVSGPPATWTEAPAAVAVPLTATIPVNATPGTLPLFLRVDGSSASEYVMAELSIVDGVDATIAPAMQTAAAGTAVTYTLTISNLEATGQDYTVTATGEAGVTLPGSFFVPGGQSADFAFTASADQAGPQPFILRVATASGAADNAVAVVDVASGYGAGPAGSDPTDGAAVAGLPCPAIMAFTLSNLGSLPDTYDVSATAPAGWGVEITLFGQPVSQVTLPPGGLASRRLQLALTPPAGATPGTVPVTVTAQSAQALATLGGTVQVLNLEVTVAFLSAPGAIDPAGTAEWQVRVSNQGDIADAYDLSVATLQVIGPPPPPDNPVLYLPLVMRQ